MTLTEFSDEFDIQYDSIAGNSAPALNAYEKSVYLTRAQLELIKNKYNPKGNKYQEGFEMSQKRRRDLNNLLRRESFIAFMEGAYGKVVELEDKVFLIIREDATIDIDNCGPKLVDVKPVRYDSFNQDRKNPFRQANRNKVLRLDTSIGVELVTKYPLQKYTVDYIGYPKPIILEDLSNISSTENLSIEGYSQSQECELHKSVHPEILNRAVELALRDYKSQDLQSKLSLDSRDE